jgi:iron uptake system component EfeO
MVRRQPARALVVPAILVPLTVLLAGFAGDVKQTVEVNGTEDACTLDTTTLDAGKTKFDVANDSGEELEGYVYTTGGDVVNEVEHIADGTSRSMTVQLDAGDYEFACKPEGDDIRTPFTVR